MYTKYFGFSEKPFTLTPNPRFIYLSNNHKEAFAHLLYGINNHYGFIELIGEVGTGKTTVLRTLLGQLQDDNYRTALIFNPCLSGVELLRSINHEFGIDATSEYTNELLGELNRFLLKESIEGKTVVLVIDEAQNLQPDVLEQIRLISNLETENDKLIQIILAGQPELESILERPDLRQLNQRIAVRYKLMSMSKDETRAYIRHRMEIAGETGGVSFSNGAYTLIYLYSHGIPRLVNVICDRALVVAYGDERRKVTAMIVAQGIKELLHFPQARKFKRSLTVMILLTLLLLTGAAAWYISLSGSVSGIFSNTPTSTPAAVSTASPSVTASPVTAATTSQSEFVTRFKQEITAADQREGYIKVFNSLADTWGVRHVKKINGSMEIAEMFSHFAANRGLRISEFNGDMNQVVGFDLPFIIISSIKGDLGAYCIAVTSVSNGIATISPPVGGKTGYSIPDLAAVSSGRYYIVWQNTGKIPDRVNPGDARNEVKSLQKLLKQSGFYHGTIGDSYDTATIKAVTDYQTSKGLPINSTLGELTLATLSRFDTTRPIPSLQRK